MLESAVKCFPSAFNEFSGHCLINGVVSVILTLAGDLCGRGMDLVGVMAWSRGWDGWCYD